MMPWNPIHRYAGLTSSLDAAEEAARSAHELNARLDGWEPRVPPQEPRTPLGFVDVRADATGREDEGAPDATVVEQTSVQGEASAEPEAEPGASEPVTPDSVAADDDEPERVPFYRREISFSRKGGDLGDAQLAAEHESEPKPLEVTTESQETRRSETHELQPIIREPGAAEAASTAAATPVEMAPPAPVAKVPLHKRELSLGRRNGKSKKTASRGAKSGSRRAGQRIVGLKVGASQLAAAVVQESNGRHELVQLARTPLAPGIVIDGEIRDAESLVAALRTFFSEHKLPTRDVRIGLASNRIGVRTFELAGIDDEMRFDNAVRFKAHEVLPIAMHESVLDYRVLEERQNENGDWSRRILLVVAPRDQVEPYADVAQRAGLKLAGIDLEALGLLRAFVEPQHRARMEGDTATVVVAIGHEASTLLVAGGGVSEFTRVFDWGGSTLQDAVAQELKVPTAEASTILRHLSLSGNSARIEGLDDEARNRAIEAVRLRLTPFARELVSSLQFYQTQPESLGIGEIVITGGTSQLDGLGEALHQMIGVSVRVGDPLQRLAVRRGSESGFESVLGSLAVPVGLAIDDDPKRSVDLTPRAMVRESRGVTRLVPALVPVAAAVPIIALGALFFQAHGKVSDRNERLAQAKAQFASLPVPKGPTIDASVRGAQAARASAVAQVLGSRPAWDATLRDLSRVVPANVWLTSLKATASHEFSVTPVPTAAASTTTPTTPATPTAPTAVNISGFTFSQADVATLLARLSALPSFQNVQLGSTSQATIGKKNVIQFTILADTRGAGGGA